MFCDKRPPQGANNMQPQACGRLKLFKLLSCYRMYKYTAADSKLQMDNQEQTVIFSLPVENKTLLMGLWSGNFHASQTHFICPLIEYVAFLRTLYLNFCLHEFSFYISFMNKLKSSVKENCINTALGGFGNFFCILENYQTRRNCEYIITSSTINEIIGKLICKNWMTLQLTWIAHTTSSIFVAKYVNFEIV